LKRRNIRELIAKEKIKMACIQETKCENWDSTRCRELWGFDSYEFVSQNAVNTAGGLLTIWEKGVFRLVNTIQGDGFLITIGCWGGS
jgi:hypothetical protein